MADGDLMDLQEVLQTLGISEQDLQNMVAQGKLKAVRAGRTVKFRAGEVMSMKSGKSTEPTIIIPQQAPRSQSIDESAATVVPEAPAGVVPVETQEISLDDEELEILPLEDEAAATQAEAPIAMDEELTVAEEVEEEYEDEMAAGPRSRSSRRSGRMSRRVSQAMAYQQESPIWSAALAVTLLILLFSGSIYGVILSKGYYDEENNKRYVPKFIEWVYENFKDPGGPAE
ncbi:MAG: helix-turn-helix domain-containing protein [Planctomycetes bacterium]|nr:helix-turn-helix domain-containing protein [Planctomycetota bacterium]